MKEIWGLFYTFTKVGMFTFGGGFAMIPAIRREVVDVRGWIKEEDISDCIAICQSLPGAFAINAAIFIGKQVKGTIGALVACLGMVLPAFLSILIILIFLGQVEDNVYVLGAFEGIKAASVALICVTVYRMGKTILKNPLSYIIAIGSFILIALLQYSAILAIISGGVIGFLEYKYRKRKRGKRY